MQVSKAIITYFLSACLLIQLTCSHVEAQTGIRITTEQNVISVDAGERPLLRYRYQDVPFKPYVQQLFSPDGINILRDAPADHLHHHALMFAVTVDGVNFWEEQQAPGRQVHRAVIQTNAEALNGISRAYFTEYVDWLSPRNQDLLLKEERTIELCPLNDPSVTLLKWRSKFTLPAGKDSATLTGAHYHGLGMRFVESMDKTGQFLNAAAEPGTIFRGDERLVQASWCAYTAPADGKPVTVAMFGHPDNPRHPTQWFTMTNPFAYVSATLNLHQQPLKITSDKSLVLCYAVALCDGRLERDQIEQLYRRWLTRSCPAMRE